MPNNELRREARQTTDTRMQSTPTKPGRLASLARRLVRGFRMRRGVLWLQMPDPIPPPPRQPTGLERLIANHARMREAGNNLAIAALRVVNDYDGCHRLALAVADWSKAVADEGGRAHSPNGRSEARDGGAAK